MISRLKRVGLAAVARGLWAATLLTLPVTSFRYFPAAEGAYVRPLAFFPLSILLFIVLIRLVRREISVPHAAPLTPLVAFLLIALATSAVGILLAPVPLRGQDVIGRIVRAWATVLVGVGFFVAAIMMNRDAPQVRSSVRWLLAGLVITILWSGVQASAFYLNAVPKVVVTQWQRMFSLRELIRTNRISGMAYEPSWLAGQLGTIYLPWLLAALLTGIRVTRIRWLEPALLVVAVVLVVATFSRGGVFMAGFSLAVTLAFAGRGELRKAWSWFISGFSRLRDVMWRLAVVALVLASIGGGLFFLGQKNYFARLWSTRATGVTDFLIQNSAGARAAYLASAWNTFADYPWTGVGLGASGLYMYARLPDWALTSVPEIARQLSPQNSLYPNPKSMYARLLAEAGILGLGLFLAFQFSMFGEALDAFRRNSALWRYIGIAGVCSWIALVLYNVTQDSFATPNLWINLGILAGLSGASGKVSAPR